MENFSRRLRQSRYRPFILVSLLLLGIFACSLLPADSGSGETVTPESHDSQFIPPGSSAGSARPVAQTHDDWQWHNDPLGFKVQLPEGYSAETTSAGQIIIRSPQKESFALVQPFFLKETAVAQDWLKTIPDIFAEVWPGAEVKSNRQIMPKPDQAAGELSYGDGASAGKAALLVTIYEKSGILYAVSAPENQFESAKKTLVEILSTLQFTEPDAAANPPGSMVYMAWQDPKENAFSLEVPKEWQVDGGLYRFASVDTRQDFVAVSPEGDITIRGGDRNIPSFALPNQMLEAAGIHEGSQYSPGYGLVMLVKSYMPGKDFAREYVKTIAAADCGDLAFTEERDRPDASSALNEIYQKLSAAVKVSLSTGEVSFTCRKNGQPYVGYFFAGTMLSQTDTVGNWNLTSLVGYLARTEKVSEAQAVLTHMLMTYKLNPQWAAMQQNIAANTSEIVTDTNNTIAGMISDSYWNRQAAQDNAARNFSNMILGQTDVVDPETGETWKVASGHNYYWRKEGTDTIAGSDIYDMPDIDFAPLLEY